MEKILKDLVRDLDYQVLNGTVETKITKVVYDSRKIEKGCIFVCIVGTKLDSHMFIPDAVEKGAAAIVVEREADVQGDISVIQVENTRHALALISAAFFNFPSKKMTTIAITGTKGKTTVSYMIKEILEKAGNKVGIIGTIGAFYDNVKIETKNTTPESYELQRILDEMQGAGCQYVVMEVSSQAFLYHRVDGMQFDYGIFTNISPDHIGEGEHKDFEDYLRCKGLLFQNCKIGIINQDDDKWKEVIHNHTCEIAAYGFTEGAMLRGDHVVCLREPGFLGIEFQVTGAYEMDIKVGCMGRFNAYNAMAAILAAYYLKIEKEAVQRVLYGIAVKGRVELVPISEHFHLIIDYAHNAVSAESLLTTILEYNPKRLVCVFGAGGNRSKLRRYDMGEIAGKYANLSILTADNPRFEEVEDIIADIRIGMERSHGTYIEIPNRRDAIRYSIEHAQEGDIIALFGKGHEDYQEIKGVRYPFDERVVIAEIMKELSFQAEQKHNKAKED